MGVATVLRKPCEVTRSKPVVAKASRRSACGLDGPVITETADTQVGGRSVDWKQPLSRTLDRPYGVMAVLEQRIAEVFATHAGRPQAEVLTELRRVHDQMGLQLDPSGGVQLAQRISSTNLGS